FTLLEVLVALIIVAFGMGALMATLAGKFSDKHGPRLGILVGASLVFLSFVAMLLLPNSIVMIVIGAVVFDLGAQMSLVSNQSLIYALEPAARSQINALFVTAIFIAFALGSFISVRLFEVGGWVAVMGLCAISSALAAVMGLVKYRAGWTSAII
ncbi:MAG: MFS transporter, partial [Proteobacteria bacterium]